MNPVTHHLSDAHRSLARDLLRRTHAELFDNILPFWCGPAVDHHQGGWMGWLDNDLKPDRSKPKGLVVHSRILWTFSAVYQFRPDPAYRQMAERAFHYLKTRFQDRVHGGAFWHLNDAGAVIDDRKNIYGQAFYIYALAEFHRAFGAPEALDEARAVFDLIETKARDPKRDGYIELCRRDWSREPPHRRLAFLPVLSTRSMNTHLHLLEAYTNLFRVQPTDVLERRLRELIGLFLHSILDPNTGHLGHEFDARWRCRSTSYTYGHDIEASWLLCEAACAIGDPNLIVTTRAAALQIVKATRAEGLGPDGGLYQEGRSGAVIELGRECWPQAEALVGFLNAYQFAGDGAYLETAYDIWRFIDLNLADRVQGDWFWRIATNGRPDPALPKVSEWKGPYHATRACLETQRRLRGKLPDGN